MSLSVIVNVLHKSKTKGNMRLCLIAIAENASDEGVAWPGIELIRKKMGGVAAETARKAMRDAVDAGELAIAWGGGPRGQNVYWVRSGLDADAACPDEFTDALVLSAQRQAAGKVIIPDRYRDLEPAECAANPDEEELGDNPLTPPETGGVENPFYPSSCDGDPSSLLEGDPSSCLDPNRHRTVRNPARGNGVPPGRLVQVRGAEVNGEGAEAFERLAKALIARQGEPWFISWIAFSRWRSGDRWLVEVRNRLVADRIRKDVVPLVRELLGTELEIEVNARRAPPAPVQAETRQGYSGQVKSKQGKRSGRRRKRA